MASWMQMILQPDIQIHQSLSSPKLKWSMIQSKLNEFSFLLFVDFKCNSLSSCHFRCCCFFKRKKKKSPRQKWLDSQKSPEREAAVTLLRATSHSNSRDSCLNPSQDYIQASSQHNIRYPSASVLTATPTNNTPTLPI